MMDEFLEDADKEILKEVLGDNSPEVFWRFWSFAELQLDGEFTLPELEMFVNAMRRMAKRHTEMNP